MRTKALLLGALCLLLVGGLILGGAGAAAQSSEPWPILMLISPTQYDDDNVLIAVSAEDGTVLWFLGDGDVPPKSITGMIASPDRTSFLVEALDAWGSWSLSRFESPELGSQYLYENAVAHLYSERNRPRLLEYALTPDQSLIVAVSGRRLVVSPMEIDPDSNESLPEFPLETWILSDQEIDQAEIVMDPRARHAYVRVNLVSGAYGYADHAALWVDLADLTIEPVETDVVWASWSEDGTYLATFSPDEGLVIRNGETLEVFSWSADLASPLKAHGFVWGTDGQTAYYRTGDVDSPVLHRIELSTGESHSLVEEIGSYVRPHIYLGGEGQTAFVVSDDLFGEVVARILALANGQWLTDFWFGTGDHIAATSPTRDLFLMFNGNGYESSCEFRAWHKGTELAGYWNGPAALYGWTPEGLPILQPLSFEDVPERYNRNLPDRATPLPDPGWYVFDIAEDGTAIWTALPCPDCRVIPAGFPEVQLSVQRPDGAPVFAVVGTGDAGTGIYVVDLVAGTARLVYTQEPNVIRQIDWLAPGSLPLESAPAPTHDPAEGLG